MPAELPPDVTSFVIRIKRDAAHNHEVVYVTLAQLFEELDGLRYQGFGQWKGGSRYRPAILDQLLAVQKDLRLFVREVVDDTSGAAASRADDIFQPCDLSQEDITADPFGHIARARDEDAPLWEYIPAFHIYKQVTSPHELLREFAHAWERALF